MILVNSCVLDKENSNIIINETLDSVASDVRDISKDVADTGT